MELQVPFPGHINTEKDEPARGATHGRPTVALGPGPPAVRVPLRQVSRRGGASQF